MSEPVKSIVIMPDNSVPGKPIAQADMLQRLTNQGLIGEALNDGRIRVVIHPEIEKAEMTFVNGLIDDHCWMTDFTS